jgi:hypothetical protein
MLNYDRLIVPLDADAPAPGRVTGWQGITFDLVEVVATGTAHSNGRFDFSTWATDRGSRLCGTWQSHGMPEPIS